MSDVYLRGPHYELGEREAGYQSLVGFDERAAEYGLATAPGLWGWGSVFRTERSVAELAVASGIGTLISAGLDPVEIDALIVCCCEPPTASADHGSFVGSILRGIGLGDIPFWGLNLNRCANLLAALDVARAFVAAGRFRHVLVVTTDRAARDADRFVNYALFSDGAASCVVAAEPGADGFLLVATATAGDTATLGPENEISADLARAVNEQLFGPRGMKPAEVDALMHTNVFKPLLVMKERQAGFDAGQLWTDNIARVGHCFAADPLINLVDRAALGHVRPGRHYLLAMSVPGTRVGALLHKPAE
jgi:3-oxoacyl-[acyl-carrier-protein] synthase-3